MDLREFLKTINCSEGESTAFATLLSSPDGLSVVSLSRKLSVPRPTVYGYLNSLQSKGLIRKGLRNAGSLFYVESREKISDIFEEKISGLHKAKTELNKTLVTTSVTPGYKPRFTVYEGTKAYEAVFRDILYSGIKETYWMWPLSEMLKHIPEKIFFEFHAKRIKKDIWLNVLWPKSKKILIEKHPLLFTKDEKESLRAIRLLPKGIDQTMGYGIYGTKVAFLSSERENYAFIIDSAELSKAFKSTFDFLWGLSEEYSKS